MAFGFNDDRSKADLDEFAGTVIDNVNNMLDAFSAAFVLVSNEYDDSGLSVSSEDFAEKRYDSSALADLGINDINKYVVIGKMFAYESSGSLSPWMTEWAWAVDTRYPMPGIDVYFLSNGMNVQIANELADDTDFRFRVVLMKVIPEVS